jgi:hypothetical protein
VHCARPVRERKRKKLHLYVCSGFGCMFLWVCVCACEYGEYVLTKETMSRPTLRFLFFWGILGGWEFCGGRVGVCVCVFRDALSGSQSRLLSQLATSHTVYRLNCVCVCGCVSNEHTIRKEKADYKSVRFGNGMVRERLGRGFNSITGKCVCACVLRKP